MLVKKALPSPWNALFGAISQAPAGMITAHGMVCGISLPKGLKNPRNCPNPFFTALHKAEAGIHDENISFGKVVDILGGANKRNKSKT